MNNISLTGNATRDIELKYLESGTPIGNGSIAVRRSFKNKQGEYETDFFNFVAIGKVSEVMAQYIKKGDKFGITGSLQNRVWEKDDGEKRYFTEVIVSGFDFPDKPKQSSNQSNQQTQQQKPPADPFQNKGEPIDISDDMLPF